MVITEQTDIFRGGYYGVSRVRGGQGVFTQGGRNLFSCILQNTCTRYYSRAHTGMRSAALSMAPDANTQSTLVC
jgi:hypothetical protein